MNENIPSNVPSYEFLVDKTGQDSNWYIMITEGLYTGLIFRFVKFQFGKEDNPDGTRNFSFTKEIKHVPEHLSAVPLPDDEEKNLDRILADILLEVLEQYLSADEIELTGSIADDTDEDDDDDE